MITHICIDVLTISTTDNKYRRYLVSEQEWYILFNNKFVDLIRI